jgi:L-asparaginase II
MTNSSYLPLVELTRGDIIESIHFGALAVADRTGRLIASYGAPDLVTFLRSSAKPFQALPFIESGGAQTYQLESAEIALICASHSGTDEHVAAVKALQAKVGISETDLMCGTHAPLDEATQEAMRWRGEEPGPNRNNCSGKHTGMLASSRMHGWSKANYLEISQPLQQGILEAFAEMCDLSPKQVQIGIDGCSAPNFAVPLRNAALAFARLCDPQALSETRAQACRAISSAMMAHPFMVAGPGRFDTCLMEAGAGKIVAKGGAEGYQGIGLLPDALGPGSPALGIALKVSDGDLKGRARPLASLEVLRQLGALTAQQLETLSEFGPRLPVNNRRKIEVGEARPAFQLQWEGTN